MRYLLILLLLVSACSSTEPVVMDDSDQTEDVQPQDIEIVEPTTFPNTEEEPEEANAEVSYPYLSSLSDTYFNRQNEIPEAYSRIKIEIEEEEVDLFEGYRVQIYSGQDVALADTAAKRFRAWSAENIDGYQAETYTFFRSPFYRVHVGDFHDREKAIDFSNLLKRRFRDSWVVFDRVNPYNVPADTVIIGLN